jgi:hypothetical protein
LVKIKTQALKKVRCSMLRLSLETSAILLLASAPSAVGGQEVPLHSGTILRFATAEEGKGVLSSEDAFTRSLSRFDLQSRLKARDDVQTADLLKFAAMQVEVWSDEDVAKLTGCIESLRTRLAKFPPLFPATVLLVKTTGLEEGNAAYCRQNTIVLPRRMLQRPAEDLERLLTHELFHILSRHDLERQQKLYAVVGFRPCGEIELPPSLRDRKITNPDAPLLNYSIELQTDEGPVPVTPILYASPGDFDPTANKTFFQYMQFRLLQFERDGEEWRAALNDAGEPILLDPKDEPSYHEQIGRNTQYVIHAEEVLAENFVHLVLESKELPSPEIVERLRSVLMGESNGAKPQAGKSGRSRENAPR